MAIAPEASDFDVPEVSSADRLRRLLVRLLVYGILSLWVVVCLFPIYWTVTTSFKRAPDVMRSHLVPFVDFEPQWLGWRSLGRPW